MKEYFDIVNNVLQEGERKQCRGDGETISLFNYNYKLDISNKFPLLTTKKINWKNIVIENLWFLSGDSSPDFLHRHGIKFWNPWIDLNGKLPQAYGEFWRNYPTCDSELSNCMSEVYNVPNDIRGFDQFAFIIDEIICNPNSRRLVLTNWYAPNSLKAALPPCHLLSIFNIQNGKLNLHLTQRSCDVPVGLPFNIAGYALLLSLVGHLTKLPVKYFAHSIIDTHIYTNQLPGIQEQLSRPFGDLPTLKISDTIKTVKDIDEIIRTASTDEIMDLFKIENYNPQGYIKFPILV